MKRYTNKDIIKFARDYKNGGSNRFELEKGFSICFEELDSNQSYGFKQQGYEEDKNVYLDLENETYLACGYIKTTIKDITRIIKEIIREQYEEALIECVV